MAEKTLGARVRELRQERGLTQNRLAELTDLDDSYLSKVENDRLEHTPSIKALQRLARALDVDELELMELANKVPPVLSTIAGDKEALRFFRVATGTRRRPDEWRRLTAYLERGRRR